MEDYIRKEYLLVYKLAVYQLDYILLQLHYVYNIIDQNKAPSPPTSPSCNVLEGIIIIYTLFSLCSIGLPYVRIFPDMSGIQVSKSASGEIF